ncbi:MAG: DUF2304 domain-containing protein [Gammaproteobacteria bacterium]|jgi:hypothetical protein|nr:DUF2304 domain-containing protein [Gammaproteobacteria bacterium]
MTPFPILTLLAVVVAVLMLWLIRRDRLPVSHSLWWLGAAFVILAFGIFPGLIDTIAAFFGVSYAPSIAFIIAILILIIKALLEDLEVSKTRRRQIRMAQKLSILEHRLEQLQQQLEVSGAAPKHRQPSP